VVPVGSAGSKSDRDPVPLSVQSSSQRRALASIAKEGVTVNESVLLRTNNDGVVIRSGAFGFVIRHE
jgi:hypothetical protein